MFSQKLLEWTFIKTPPKHVSQTAVTQAISLTTLHNSYIILRLYALSSKLPLLIHYTATLSGAINLYAVRRDV